MPDDPIPLFVPYFPPPPLAGFVEMFWHVYGRTPYQREKILPTEHIELIINLGDPHKVFPDENDDSQFQLNVSHWICGIQTDYILTEATGISHMVGVRFKPGGVYPFLDFPISELSDLIVDLDLVLGRWTVELREKLLAASDPAACFAILSQHLLERLRADLNGWDAVNYAVQRLQRPSSSLSIRDLSDEIGWSQKHLIQQCKKMVGVSPKLLARITRFHHMLNSIDPNQPINWAEVANQCHYYDQAHFNRDFQAFSGLTPTDYMALRARLLGQELVQGEAVKFVPVQ